MSWFKRKPQIKFADNSKDTQLELVYTDGVGNKYYKFKNPAAIPTMRYLLGWQAIEYANMGVNAKSAVAYIDEAVQSINTNNSAEAAYKLLTFKDRIVKADPEKAYLEISSCYVLMNNENPKTYDASMAQLKVALWSGDVDARAFFLTSAFKILKDLTNTSGGVMRNALVEQTNMNLRILQLTLRRLSEADSTSSITSTGESPKATS